MNIQDFEGDELWEEISKEYGTDDSFEILFKRQAELMVEYVPIEFGNLGLIYSSVPVNPHNPVDQFFMKHTGWCVVEEIVESSEAKRELNFTKEVEELVDALHFMVELCIMGGIDPTDVRERWDRLRIYSHPTTELIDPGLQQVIYNVGLAMWQLRNKPWKNSQILTDVDAFQGRLLTAIIKLIDVIMHKLETPQLRQVILVYLRKSEVNKFRIRSNY